FFDLEHGDDVRSATVSEITKVVHEQFPYSKNPPKLDVLINNAGVNGIDFLEDITAELWDRVMDTNARGIMKMSQACLPFLKESKGTIVNIVSNAAHMPMTSSLCYNASKGAALIMTKQMARELTRRHGITVFSVSPNKLKGTEMSRQIDAEVVRTRGWTMEEAQKYQLAGLLAGEETDPHQVAEFITFLLQDKEHHKFLTGCDLQYGL
ncbi:MAG TPA: SDR family oxidoreductase, partial [Methanosarcina sp.]|nr:SDR family oxidoreductase [Methanosarcina sp.]